LPSFTGPFPGTPNPIPGEQPLAEEAVQDDCTGKGVRLFFGLCFEAKNQVWNTKKIAAGEKPDEDDAPWAKTKEVAEGFENRGYTTTVVQAGTPWSSTGCRSGAHITSWDAS
jgi:hypothetical protein